MAGSVQRMPVKFAKLAAASEYGGAMTVLITGKGIGPTGGTSVPENSPSGLIMLLHVNASGYSGGVVSIPPQSIVRVPGHGRTELENAEKFGGPVAAGPDRREPDSCADQPLCPDRLLAR